MLSGVLQIEPQPTPRPRVKRMGGVYYPSGYLQYKQALVEQFVANHSAELFATESRHSYIMAELTFYFAYPKSTAKKHRVDNQPCRAKGDLDNLAKGVLDAMEQAGLMTNDRELARLDVAKYWTTGISRIHYYLDPELPPEDDA